jgi:hypothetical protein
MPPWLIELLQKNNSLGFADTLATLAKIAPVYSMLQSSDPRRIGNTNVDQQGNPVIALSKMFQQDYSKQGGSGYKGYKPVDKQQKLGDYVLGHEFGHVIASGANNNIGLTDQLNQLSKDGYKDESLADDFQNSVQFLRNPQADLSKLNERQMVITNILLQQPIYAQHPINQRRMLEQILMGQLPNR